MFPRPGEEHPTKVRSLAVSACAALAVLAVAVPAASAGVAFASVYTPAGTNTWTVVAVDRAGNSSGVSNAATLTVRVDTALC